MGKGIWIGYTGSMPIASSVLVTRDNYTTFFSLSNGTYKFNPDTNGWWTNTNSGVNSSTATTTLTIKSAATVKIEYDYGTEANYDKVTLTAGGTTILSAVSGAVTTGSKTVDLTANQTIVMTYAKDSSSHSNGDYAKFKFTIISTTTGSVTNVARKVNKPFIGVSGVARTVKQGFVGVNNVARKWLGSTIINANSGNISLSAYSQANTSTSYDSKEAFSVTLPAGTKSFTINGMYVTGYGIIDTFRNPTFPGNYTYFDNQFFSTDADGNSCVLTGDNITAVSGVWYIMYKQRKEDRHYYTYYINLTLDSTINTDGTIKVTGTLGAYGTGTGSYRGSETSGMSIRVQIICN